MKPNPEYFNAPYEIGLIRPNPNPKKRRKQKPFWVHELPPRYRTIEDGMHDMKRLERGLLLERAIRPYIEDLYFPGDYLFTAVPIDDGFSRHPGQSKEFMFIELDNGRLTIQPTDKVLFRDMSFGGEPSWPKNLKRMDREWSGEA